MTSETKAALTYDGCEGWGVYRFTKHGQWVLCIHDPTPFAVFRNVKQARKFRDELKEHLTSKLRIFRVRVNVKPGGLE